MEFTIRQATNNDIDAIRHIVFAVLKEYGLEPDPAGTDRDLEDIEESYMGGGGIFWVIEGPGSEVVGCGGLFRVDSDDVELRKMYLLPEARGRGLGKRMLSELIARARLLGAWRITLETASVLTDAIRLYESYGFVRVSRDHLASRCDQAWELKLR